MKDKTMPALKVVTDANITDSFSELLIQSYTNMTKLNSQLDYMQTLMYGEFPEADIEDQASIFKCFILRHKQESSLYTSILSLASKHEQIKSILTKLLTAGTEEFTAKKLSPELKAITDELKKGLKDTLEEVNGETE